MRVGRRYQYRFVHHVQELPGTAWAEEHPHVYTIDVEAEGEPPLAAAMGQWDHYIAMLPLNLNDRFPSTTVESLAATLLRDLKGALKVRVQEDDSRWAEAER